MRPGAVHALGNETSAVRRCAEAACNARDAGCSVEPGHDATRRSPRTTGVRQRDHGSARIAANGATQAPADTRDVDERVSGRHDRAARAPAGAVETRRVTSTDR